MKVFFRFFCVLVILGTSLFAAGAKESQKIKIWQGIKGLKHEIAYLHYYPAQTAEAKSSTTPAVIICPGGSYHHLGLKNEGKTSAEWFSRQGTAAFVLEYRVAVWRRHYPAMMQDVQRAIQLLRENAQDYAIDAHNIGLIGYSAGGHLVTWAAEFAERTDELEKMGITHEVSLKPDWIAPIYPVVSMQDDIYHHWSRKSLLHTKHPSETQKNLFSLELQVPLDMPPVYLVACKDDPVVKFENSERLYKALLEKNADVTFKVYEQGGHGFGMVDNEFMQKTHWNDELAAWLKEKGFMQ